MRCSCQNCGAYMAHSERDAACVCPECGERCSACLGTNTVLTREELRERGRNMEDEPIEKEYTDQRAFFIPLKASKNPLLFPYYILTRRQKTGKIIL